MYKPRCWNKREIIAIQAQQLPDLQASDSCGVQHYNYLATGSQREKLTDCPHTSENTLETSNNYTCNSNSEQSLTSVTLFLQFLRYISCANSGLPCIPYIKVVTYLYSQLTVKILKKVIFYVKKS